ncbi:hypothetical protein GCM10020219_035260 [Nonomuraea dietziae]
MKIWVPSEAAADVLTDLPDVECVVYDGRGPAPDGADEVEVWIPPLIPVPDIPGLMAAMKRLKLVQTVTAGVEPYRPHLPHGVTLCNARGVHDAGTAEWAVGAMIAVLREFPGFVDAQRRGEWTYHHHRCAGRREGADRRVRLHRRRPRTQARGVRGRGGKGGQDGSRGRPPDGGARRDCCPRPTSWCCSCPPPPRRRAWSTRPSWRG